MKRCAYIALSVLLSGLLCAVCCHRFAAAVSAGGSVAAASSYSDDCYAQGGCAGWLGCSIASPEANAPALSHAGKTIDGRCRRFYTNHNSISFKAGRMLDCEAASAHPSPFGLPPVGVKCHGRFFIRLGKLVI